MGVRFGTIAGRVLDEENPVNWDHPANKGLVSRWQVISGTSFYGGTLRDLCRTRNLRNDGTLTNAPTWGDALGRRGGFGSLNFNGSTSNAYVNVGNVAALQTAPFTWLAWVRVTTTATRGTIFAADQNNGPQWRIDNSGSNHHQFVKPAVAIIATSTSNATQNTWTHVGVSWDGTVAQLYTNGNADGSGSNAQAMTASPMHIGIQAVATTPFSGAIDALMVYNRLLTAAEVAAVYAESLRGDLNSLNWLSTRTYLNAASAATFNPGWVTGATRGVLGTGVL